MELWLVVVAVLVLVVAAALLTRKPDPFRAAAATLGLTLSRSVPELSPRLEGMVKGLAVKLDIAGQREPGVRYRVFYPALGMALRLERETTISRTLGQLGSGDQEIGARNFDDTFRVNTSRPDALQKMMTPGLRRHLVALLDVYPGVVVTDGEITLLSDDAEPMANEIVTTVQDLVAAADLLVAARPPVLETPPPRPTTPPPTKPPQPAAPPRERSHDTAATSQTDATPSPAEATASPPPEPEPVVAAPPPPPPPPPSGLPDGFFDEVFGVNRMSFEDDDQLAQEIKGSIVNLSGTVKQASAYTDRSDLNPQTGTKAVITVAQIQTDLYGMTDIDAVVYLHGRTELSRGETARFTGTLDGFDAFMRNLFVSDASLTGR